MTNPLFSRISLATCVVALVSGNLATGSGFAETARAEPLVTSSGSLERSSVIEIPGDLVLPNAGEELVIHVPSGAKVRFSENLTKYYPSVVGKNLILKRADDGRLVLQDFFNSLNGTAVIILEDGTEVSALELRAHILAQSETPDNSYSLGFASGGGELFALVPVVTWLLERLDFFSEAHAAEQQVVPSNTTLLVEQVWAQFRIARDIEVVVAAKTYKANTDSIVKALQGRQHYSRADLLQAKAVNMEAQLEVKEAEFQHRLSVIAHDETFGDWLEKAEYPEWQDAQPKNIDALRAKLSQAEQAAVLRHWRQREFADETMGILETLHSLMVEVRDAYYEQYESAQRMVVDVLGPERVLFQTKVRLAQRKYDLKSAEAWLLAADGKRLERYRQRPGSRP